MIYLRCHKACFSRQMLFECCFSPNKCMALIELFQSSLLYLTRGFLYFIQLIICIIGIEMSQDIMSCHHLFCWQMYWWLYLKNGYTTHIPSKYVKYCLNSIFYSALPLVQVFSCSFIFFIFSSDIVESRFHIARIYLYNIGHNW